MTWYSRNCLPFRSTCIHIHFYGGFSVAESLFSLSCFVDDCFCFSSFFFWPLYCLSWYCFQTFLMHSKQLSNFILFFCIWQCINFYHQICQGGNVPKEYYLQHPDNLSQMQSVTVPRGEKVYQEYLVDKPGSVIRYVFRFRHVKKKKKFE